jgi:hypothetical protein
MVSGICTLQPMTPNAYIQNIGDMWKFHRSMTRPFFTRERITDFDIFDKHAEETTEKMKLRLREGFSVDFQVNRLSGHCLEPSYLINAWNR